MDILEPIQQKIRVNYSYPVHFTRGVFHPRNRLFWDVAVRGETQPSKLLVVVDRGVYRHHPRLLAAIEAYCRRHPRALTLARPPLVVEGGEGVKNNPEYVDLVHQAIHRAGLCRHSYVVAVGGGAVVDMAGYAAATAHRGLRTIRLPTTTLAQADAAIGVKNGINAFGKKNFIGTFAPPYAVVNDFDFLATLSDRDWISGAAEAVKVALIKDAGFFAFLEEAADRLAQRHTAAMQETIYRCAALHLNHIATGGDPFEFGASRPLDFGHWAAHKLEQLSGYRLRHGEAVAAGMALDATYACLAGLLPKGDWERLMALLTRLGFSLHFPEFDQPEALLQGLQEFREHLGGLLTIMLPESIGRGREVHEMDPNLVRAGLALLKRRAAAAGRKLPAVRIAG